MLFVKIGLQLRLRDGFNLIVSRCYSRLPLEVKKIHFRMPQLDEDATTRKTHG